MKLQVRPVVSADFATAARIYGPEQGDFCAPVIDIIWPLTPTHTNAQGRAEWSCRCQHEIFENDPSVRFMKVVDTDNNDEMIAFGRWHWYGHGFEGGDLEYTGLKGRGDEDAFPEGMMGEFKCEFLEELFAARRGWMGEGKYWVLTTIETRAPLRKKGAGSLLLEWGLKQAKDEGVPAFLEAVEGAVNLYKKHGFREVGKQHVDGRPHGLPEFDILRMRADPK